MASTGMGLLQTFSLMDSSSCANKSRSSVISMARVGVPNTRTLYFSNMPAFSSANPQFSPVCPPKLSKIPSGRS